MSLQNTTAIAELRENPFFVVSGPGGERLACQWTAYAFGRAQSNEFEILCIDTPEKMGCLFGLVDPATAEIRLRPEVVFGTYEAVEGGGTQDLDWRGSMNDVLEIGRDWEEGEDGELVIADPDAPAEDVASPLLRSAA